MGGCSYRTGETPSGDCMLPSSPVNSTILCVCVCVYVCVCVHAHVCVCVCVCVCWIVPHGGLLPWDRDSAMLPSLSVNSTNYNTGMETVTRFVKSADVTSTFCIVMVGMG